MVYFIQEGYNGNIKIGFTEGCIKSRRQALQTGNSRKLVIVAFLKGDKDDEKELHCRFSKYSLLNEWFKPVNDIWDFINRNCQFHRDYVFLLKKRIKGFIEPQTNNFKKDEEFLKEFENYLSEGVSSIIESNKHEKSRQIRSSAIEVVFKYAKRKEINVIRSNCMETSWWCDLAVKILLGNDIEVNNILTASYKKDADMVKKLNMYEKE